LIAAALVLGYIASAVWESNHPAKTAQAVSATDTMPWVSIAQAEGVARQAGKPILYDFSAEWCAPCQLLKRTVFEDPDRARALAEVVVPVKVIDRNREEGQNPPDIEALQQRYSITGFPTLVLFDPANGRHITADGWMGPDETVQWVKSGAMSVHLGVNPDGTPLR
jgi:thiol:disulfide interchange protein